MDLRARLAAVAAALLVGGCSSSDTPFELDDDALGLPATLKEAHALASRLARETSDRAYVTELGGKFTIMDRDGRARNHSFVFHAVDGQLVFRRIEVDLIGGSPWILAETVGPPPPAFPDLEAIGDSDDAIAAALGRAELINAANPDSIPIPEIFAARIRSSPQWPENSSNSTEEPQVAWRVDFLEQMPPPSGATGVVVPWSTARFYFTVDLELLEMIVRTQTYVDNP